MSPAVQLALGRIFRLGSRQTQPGDVEEYERCRAIIMAEHDESGRQEAPGYQPNYARDRKRGAQGD